MEVDVVHAKQDNPQSRDQDAFEAGARAADLVRATSLEEAVEQGSQLLLRYLSTHGIPIVDGLIPETRPVIIGFCDGYSQHLFNRWTRLAIGVLFEDVARC